MGSDESELPRYKKIIKGLIKQKKAKLFSKVNVRVSCMGGYHYLVTNNHEASAPTGPRLSGIRSSPSWPKRW